MFTRDPSLFNCSLVILQLLSRKGVDNLELAVLRDVSVVRLERRLRSHDRDTRRRLELRHKQCKRCAHDKNNVFEIGEGEGEGYATGRASTQQLLQTEMHIFCPAVLFITSSGILLLHYLTVLYGKK